MTPSTPLASRPPRAIAALRSKALACALAAAALAGACNDGGGGGGAPPGFDPDASTVVVEPSGTRIANGTDAAPVVVTVLDSRGEPMVGLQVVIDATGQSNVIVQPATPTDADGRTTGFLASTFAETKVVGAMVVLGTGPAAISGTDSVAFVGDPSTISATLSSATASPDSDVLANDVDASTITVTVADAFGNPVEGQTVVLESTGTSHVLVQPAAPTDAAGAATGSITSTLAETKTITARINPGPSEVVVVQQPTVAFIADAGSIDPALCTATANPSADVVADGATLSTITVTVVDAFGNPVAGQTVGLQSTGADNGIAQPAPTDAAGVATGTIASTRAETKTITAIVNPGPSGVAVLQQPTVGFVADPSTISATLSTVDATPSQGLAADGVTTSTITVLVVDAFGNGVPGQVVQLAATGSNNLLVQPVGPTDAGGFAIGALASTTAESKTITATVNPATTAIVLAQQPVVTFSADPGTISSGLSGVVAAPALDVVADGTTLSTITVTVRDANGNLVPGQTVALGATGAGNVLTQPAATTDLNGVATGTIASTVAETKTISATINPGPSQVVVAQQATVAFVPDPSTIDPTLSTATANPSLGLASNGVDASTITVTVRDGGGNPVPGQTVALAATGSGNVLVQPSGPTDALGVATGTIASTGAETKTITATVNPGPGQVVLAQQPTVTFGGDPGQIDPAQCSAVASPSRLLAADGVEVSTITVTVRDVNGSTVSGQTVALAATGSGNVLVQPLGVTDPSGVATGTLASTAAEGKTVTATVNPGPSQVVVQDQPVVAFAWTPANARFVRAGGTDPLDCSGGTSPATAWATIGKAASCAPAGATVYVGAGTYAESVSILSSGSAGSPIRFVADASGELTGDAGTVRVDAGGTGPAFRLDGASWIEIEGFEVVGGTALGGIRLGDAPCAEIALRGNSVHGNGAGIVVRDAVNVSIEHNSISANFAPAGDGVLLDGCGGVVVRDNAIYANAGSGVEVVSGSIGVVLDANTIHANVDDQVAIDGSGNSVTMTNNVVVLGPQDGVLLLAGSALSTGHNDVWGNGGTNWNGVVTSGTDFSVDPGFVDPDGADGQLGGAGWADDDFRLDVLLPSPVLDAGSGAAASIETSDGLSLADRTSRPDGVLDGSTPDGSTLNLGFHYPVAGDDQPELAPGDVRITYGEGTMRQPRRRLYEELAAAWSAEGSAPPTVDTIRWVVEKIAPLASGEELVATLAGTPAGGRLDLLRWSGSAWSRELRSIAIASGEVDKRGFDVEYEPLSGDVVIVYSVNGSTPVYRTRTNAGWSAETPLPLNDGAGPNPDVNTGLVQWVELEARPGTNELSVAYADSNRDLVTIAWNGSQWLTTTAHVLATDLWTSDAGGVVLNRPFDVAYEGVAGGLIAAWSRSTSGSVWWSRRAAGSTSYSTHNKIPAVPNFQPNHVDVGSEPGTSRVAMCGMDIESMSNPERLALATWNGTAWVNGGGYDVGAANVPGTSGGDFPCAAGWLGATGQAVCVYAGGNAAALDWASWISGSGWVVRPDVAVPGKSVTESVQLASNALGHAMAVVSDSTGALWAARFDGASWTVTNGGAALETTLSSSASVPFDAVQKNP